MASQTYDDIKKTGLRLTQSEAQRLATEFTNIAHGRNENGELFPKADEALKATGRADEKPEEVKSFVLKAHHFAKDKTLKEQGYKVGDTFPRAENTTIERTVTQEDLDSDEALKATGINVGDLHTFAV
jgi:hypothetical protein